MLELLMSIAVSSMLAAALVSNLAQTESFSNAGQNQLLAACIAQEMIDNARNTSYSDLVDNIGTHEMVVNRVSDESCPDVLPRALLMDEVDLDFTTESKRNAFWGTAVESIEYLDAGDPNVLRITVEVSWKEAGNTKKNYVNGSNGTNAAVLSTLVSKNGIHN